jgi:signal transduction histidine kinase
VTAETTEFAPPDRKPLEEVAVDCESIARTPAVRDVLNAVSEVCVLLNQERQIVYANDALISLLDIKDPRSLCGVRPGEALDCVHACERREGCGTTEACRMCGALNAILARDVRECRILQKDGSALDLRVRARPLSINGKEYTLFSAIDISHEKRRRTLERIFFHDILNTADALRGFCDLLLSTPHDDEGGLQAVHLLSNRLIEEITAQKQLLAAESNELSTSVIPIQSLKFIDSVSMPHNYDQNGKSYSIRIDPASKNITFESDVVLLRRVMGNLIKNAIEASKDGDVITVGCRSVPEGIEFWIQNPGVMKKEVQLQVFQRSFSTKGAGRGLGTYGAKLITERYLKGHVSFTSSPDEGTMFTATYPIDLAPR